MLGTRKHTIAFPAQPLSTSSSTVPELQPISRSAAFRHHTCCAIGKDERDGIEGRKAAPSTGRCRKPTCQKSALTFATYCVHPVSDGDREQVKITRREENGTEPGARRSEKGTEKPRRNRLHRTPTSRRIRRRAARTYDRLRFGAGDTTVRQSAALRTESSGAIPAPSGNRAIPGIATGDCQRPSSSASAAIVATP